MSVGAYQAFSFNLEIYQGIASGSTLWKIANGPPSNYMHFKFDTEPVTSSGPYFFMPLFEQVGSLSYGKDGPKVHGPVIARSTTVPGAYERVGFLSSSLPGKWNINERVKEKTSILII
jgi:hypothetical protein